MWKGMRSLETGKAFGSEKYDKSLIANKLITPTPDRLNYIRFAMASGYSVADIAEMTSIDPWFLGQMKEVVDLEAEMVRTTLGTATKEQFRAAKRFGISDSQLAKTWGVGEIDVRTRRKELGVTAVFSRVDTCAAEFESFTPYLYSNYESACEADRIASGRELSSTTAAATPVSRCRRWASNRSWSIAIRRPCPRITTPATVCTSSR
jgi:carbamoyl-phosphate synthase large subunit